MHWKEGEIHLEKASEQEYDDAVRFIETYDQKVRNNNNLFNQSIGITLKGQEYKGFSMKRSHIKKSTIEECKFIKCALTGSTFTDCMFRNCEFDHSNMQVINFAGTKFKSDMNIKNSGNSFDYSDFSNSVLYKMQMHASYFSNCLFENALIDSCSFEYCSFEDANFNGATLRNISMTDLNIEYANLYGATFENVCIPLMQLPYTFGGLQYYFEQQGLNMENHKNNTTRRLSKDNYRGLLERLSIYYERQNEFFPLTNICLLNGKKEEFKQLIEQGIQYAFVHKSIRDVKHLVSLAKHSGWYTTLDLHNLFYQIADFITKYHHAESAFAYKTNRYIGELRDLLLSYPIYGQPDKAEVRFVINNTNSEEITELTREILVHISTELLKQNISANFTNIIINKNSPLEIILNLDFGSIDTAMLSSALWDIIKISLPVYLTHRFTIKREKSKNSKQQNQAHIIIKNTYINIVNNNQLNINNNSCNNIFNKDVNNATTDYKKTNKPDCNAEK